MPTEAYKKTAHALLDILPELDAETIATTESLVEDGVVAEADGWFVPVGRFTCPVRGKYSTYQYGAL
jgi:hypothetical protein